MNVAHRLNGKTAFACWENRIAPVFDTAQEVQIVQVRSGCIAGESVERVAESAIAARALRLKALDIDGLVCGAISTAMLELISAQGIQVVPCVAGDLREVIQAWMRGELGQDAYAMPGCHDRRKISTYGLTGASRSPEELKK